MWRSKFSINVRRELQLQLKSSQGKILNATQNKHQIWQMPEEYPYREIPYTSLLSPHFLTLQPADCFVCLATALKY